MQDAAQTESHDTSFHDSSQAGVQGSSGSKDALQQNQQQLDYTTLNSKDRKRLALSSPLAPIWTVPSQPIFFDADRSAAKQLAKALTGISFEQLLHV